MNYLLEVNTRSRGNKDIIKAVKPLHNANQSIYCRFNRLYCLCMLVICASQTKVKLRKSRPIVGLIHLLTYKLANQHTPFYLLITIFFLPII